MASLATWSWTVHLFVVAEGPDEDGDDGEAALARLHDARDVREVHLDRVLVLVLLHVHHL